MVDTQALFLAGILRELATISEGRAARSGDDATYRNAIEDSDALRRAANVVEREGVSQVLVAKQRHIREAT